MAYPSIGRLIKRNVGGELSSPAASVTRLPRAEDIRQKLGVNDHVKTWGRLTTFAQRAGYAADIGFTWVRIGVHAGLTAQNVADAIAAYASLGLRYTLIFDSAVKHNGIVDPYSLIPSILANGTITAPYRALCMGIENVNEPDGATIPGAAQNDIIAKDAYIRAQLDAAGWTGVPVWGCPVSTPGNWPTLNAASPAPALRLTNARVSHVHGYGNPALSSDGASSFGLGFADTSNYYDPWVASNGRDRYWTEVGHFSSPVATPQPGGTTVVRDTSSAPLICRFLLYLAFNMAGVAVYSLTDENISGSGISTEDYFGLTKMDGTYKASATAIKTLIASYLKDVAADARSFTTVKSPIISSTLAGGTNVYACQRADGKILVFIWRAGTAWCTTPTGGSTPWIEGTLQAYAKNNITLNFNRAYTVTAKTLIAATTTALGSISTYTGVATVPDDDVLILELV